MAAHQLPSPALNLVTSSARTVMGLAPAGPVVGSIADLLAIEAHSERQAIADASLSRRTYKRGRLTAVTQVDRSFTGHTLKSNW
jgi:hypothetical protein